MFIADCFGHLDRPIILCAIITGESNTFLTQFETRSSALLMINPHTIPNTFS